MDEVTAVRSLSSSLVTRGRAKLAFPQLRALIAREHHADIDLRDVSPLSMTFLDEFVLRLLDESSLDQVTFIVDSLALRKLQRIAEIRDAEIAFKMFPDAEVQRTTPATRRDLPWRRLTKGSSKSSLAER